MPRGAPAIGQDLDGRGTRYCYRDPTTRDGPAGARFSFNPNGVQFKRDIFACAPGRMGRR